jgi:hypothetical protein
MNIAGKNIRVEEALNLYKKLLINDPVFAECWYDCDQDFLKWCLGYDDLKHIKREDLEWYEIFSDFHDL